MVFICVLSIKADVIDDAEAFWTFDSDFTDSSSSGSTHNGTAMNGALITKRASTFISGSGALYLDGVNDYVDIGSISFSNELTISVWMRPNELSLFGGHACVLLGDCAANINWIRVEDARVYVRFDNDSKAPATTDFSKKEWQHFVLTRDDSGNITVYRNKESVASDTTGLDKTFTPNSIGFKSSNHYRGMIDDMGLWNRVLSSTEIEELFNRGNESTASIVNDNDAIIATIDVLGDGQSDSAVIKRSSDGKVSLGGFNRGDYEIKINGELVNPSNGVMIATVRTNSVIDGINGERWATVAAARNGEFHSDAVTLTTHKINSSVFSELAAHTALVWFPFADNWIGAQVNADGTIYAATDGIESSLVTVVYPLVAPAYDISLPGLDADSGMLFVIPAPTNTEDSCQAKIASTMHVNNEIWRVSVLSSSARSTTNTIASPFSFLYLSYDTEGLVGGRINADGTQYSDESSAGGFTSTNTAIGRYTITLDNYTPNDGVLMLSILDGFTYAQNNYLTYQASSDGRSFEILNHDLDGIAANLSLQDKSFVFAFMPFPPLKGTCMRIR